MPNLKVTDFEVNSPYEDTSITITFIVANDGLWTASGVVVVVYCQELELVIYDGASEPFDVLANDSVEITVSGRGIPDPGKYELLLVVDPDHAFNETYSQYGGSPRSSPLADNAATVQVTIRDDVRDVVAYTVIGGVGGVAVGAFVRKKMRQRAEGRVEEIEGVKFEKWE